MSKRARRGAMASVTALGAVGLALAAAPAPAAPAVGRAAPAPVKVISGGLDDPYGIQVRGDYGYVAENVSGEVTRVSYDGRQKRLFGDVAGVSGVGVGNRYVYAVLGGGDETGQAPPAAFDPTTVLRYDPRTGKVREIANLLDYELKRNPDGQVQFDADHQPYDTLSNPFAMHRSRYGLFVADGGGNDVLRVDPHSGKVHTFFVPPTITSVPECREAGAQANPGTVGCDSVPTGLDTARGSVYVSTLGSERPGAGRVYQVNPRSGKVQHTWRGLTAPTGVAVAPNGTVYVSSVLAGAGPGDPTTFGRITRIAPDGKRTEAQVTMPIGLEYTRGRLFASSYSVGSFFGLEHAGRVVEVRPSAFR